MTYYAKDVALRTRLVRGSRLLALVKVVEDTLFLFHVRLLLFAANKNIQISSFHNVSNMVL